MTSVLNRGMGPKCLLNDLYVPHIPEKPRRALMIAVIFCLTMTLVEGIFGLMANSLAILSDAVHMLTDVFTLSISLFALHASTWTPTVSYTYGWRRAEVVGALCSVFTTWALVVWILFGAAERVVELTRCAMDIHRENCEIINSNIMFGVGIFGLLMNIVLAYLLHSGGAHGHTHGSLSGGHHHHHHHRYHDDDDHSHRHDHSHNHSHTCRHEGDVRRSHGQGQQNGNCSSCQLCAVTRTGSPGEVTIEGDGFNFFSSDFYFGRDRHAQLPLYPSQPSSAPSREYVEIRHDDSHGSMNLRAAMLHVFCDCLQSLGVVLAAVIIWIGNMNSLGVPSNAHSYYNLADPILSVLFAIMTIATTKNLIKEVLTILLERAPSSISYSDLCEALNSVDKVEMVEDLHLWSIGPDFTILSAHLRLSGCKMLEETMKVMDEAERRCKKLGIRHTTIQINVAPPESSVTA